MDSMRALAMAVVVARDAILLTQTRHKLRKRLAICGRKEGPTLVALAIAFDQVGELLFEKRQEHRRGTGLSKQRIGGDILSTRLCRGADQRLEIAREIQRWLLPAKPPQVRGLDSAFAARPANTVAGDFYDVFARPAMDSGEPHFLLAVADVAGKSIPAALLMATFQASLKTLSETRCSLANLVAGMNHYACTNSQSGLRFTTAFLAEFDPACRALTYINAGHNAPILRRSSGAIERLSSGGLPLGMWADKSYEAGTVILEPGDWMVIFTDGVVEAVNDRDEDYGEERMLNVLRAGVTATPDELLRSMMRDLDAFVGATPQHDDVTCMLVKIA